MIKMIQKLKNKKGFTLVELIVVIAIIAILTAVIVPLIARYSAQARYTTLMDAAQTISNSANNAMSDANQKGVVSLTSFTGDKSGGTFTITPSSGAAQSGGHIDATGKATYSTDANERAAQKLWESLNDTLPAEAHFYISVNASAVKGVVYSTKNAVTDAIGSAAVAVDGFDNAYGTAATGGDALGVSGSYIPS